jgi:NAD(P) transhydrogenase
MIYAIPEVSHIGATEVERTKDSIAYEVRVSQYRELARGQITGDSDGKRKLLVSTDDLKLLGVHVVGTPPCSMATSGRLLIGDPSPKMDGIAGTSWAGQTTIRPCCHDNL